jgi:hypothetical protein
MEIREYEVLTRRADLDRLLNLFESLWKADGLWLSVFSEMLFVSNDLLALLSGCSTLIPDATPRVFHSWELVRILIVQQSRQRPGVCVRMITQQFSDDVSRVSLFLLSHRVTPYSMSVTRCWYPSI